MTIAGGQSDAGSVEGQAKNDAAAAAAANASAGNGAGKPDAEHVTYSKEEMVNIVEERLKKEKAKFFNEMRKAEERIKQLETSQKELEDLRAEKQKQEEEKLTFEERLRKTHQRELDAIASEKTKVEEEKTAVAGKYTAFLKKVELTSAAAKQDAIDPDQVYVLLRDRVVVKEDEKVVFMDEDEGEIKVEEGVKRYLGNNLHLVKNSGGAGGGARRPLASGELTVEKIRSMTREERKAHQKEIDEFIARKGVK